MFVQHPFDIAPHARRFTPAAWCLLAIGLAFAAFCTWQFAESWQRGKQDEQALAALRDELAARNRMAMTLANEASREPAERVQARLGLQRALNLSWSGLFQVLEDATEAVDSRVALAALAPVQLRPDGAEVRITALAATPEAMFEYLRSMQKDPRIQQLQLTAQQPATVGGAAVIRFQAAVLLQGAARP